MKKMRISYQNRMLELNRRQVLALEKIACKPTEIIVVQAGKQEGYDSWLSMGANKYANGGW